jgi:putative transcriptional regulator
MEDAQALRNRVRQLRKRMGLRQEDLAKQAGVTRQTIIAIEKERLNPSITVSLKIARILQEPADYVFYLDANQKVAAEAPVVEKVPSADATPPFPKKKSPPRPTPKKRPAVPDKAPEPAKSDTGGQAIWEF